MKIIEKKSVVPLPPTTGNISETLNIDDKKTNAPSLSLAEKMMGIPTDGIIPFEGEEIPEGYEEVENNIFGGGMPIGSGCDYFGTVAPEGFMFADGSEISRTEYAELFNIIGTIYGEGDRSTTFNIPDKREKVSAMYFNESDVFNELGKILGEKSHTLTVDEMPSHKHTFKAGTSSGATSGNGIVATSGSQSLTLNNYSGYKAMTDALLNTGGSQAHNIIQPTLVCNFIIKVK